MRPEDVDRLQLGFDLVNARDWDAIAQMLTDDFVLHSIFQPGRVYRGRHAFRDLIGDLGEALDGYALTCEQVMDAGERAITAVRLEAAGHASGLPVTMRAWMVWTLRDGLAVSADSYTDLDEARRAAGLTGG